MKVGNIPNDVVRRGMELFRDHVHAEVRDLSKTPDAMPVMAMADGYAMLEIVISDGRVVHLKA